jgi:Protein of unknown function (DUF1573)
MEQIIRFCAVLAFAVGAMVMVAACSKTKRAVKQNPPFVTWDKQFVELGAIKRGEKREMSFLMTNRSPQPIKIDIIDHCTCTTSDYPRGKIALGATAKIDLVFDSTEKEVDETIEARIIFVETTSAGVPRIETLKYHFSLLK